MKTKYVLRLAALALLAVACENGGESETQKSLTIDPVAMTFAAVSAPSQEVTVAAVGVEWKAEVGKSAAEWLSAVRTGTDRVAVSVTDNPKAEKRTGKVIVFVPDADDMRSRKEVTVVQQGNENPEVYSLSLSVKELEFGAKDAVEQQVVVTVCGEGLTWKAETDAEWIAVTPSSDGFGVAVHENSQPAERRGMVTVTPSDPSVQPCRLVVRQAAGELPPKMELNYTEFRFKPTGEHAIGEALLYVTTQNCGWSWRTVDEAGVPIDWILIQDRRPEYEILSITCRENMESADRIGYLDIVPQTDALETMRVTITQMAVKDYMSELTGDVDMTAVSRNAYVSMTPLNDWEERSTPWMLRFWDDGVGYDEAVYPPFSQTGGYVELELYSDRILFNDDSEYDLPAGVYAVVSQEDAMGNGGIDTITAGYQITTMWDPEHCVGSWYYYMENDEVVRKAPLTEGTLTVERTGDDYILVFDFRDDAGHALSGRREGPLSVVGIGVPSPRP